MFENIRLSFKGIWSHKMRSFLTMLGIIIGIAAIIIAVLVFAFGAFFIDVYYNWPAFIIEELAIEITETTDNLN